jgi:thiol:disulfide interchange protein DsbD
MGFRFSPRYIESGVTGIVQAVLFGIIAGFLLNLMPCVLPVVSLKVMSFVKHADKKRKELVFLGVFFSLGILTSFAVLASLAAFFGYKWGGLFQHRLFLVSMTGIVFALALSLFGVFSINAPAFAGKALKEKENYYLDAYVKGLLATLLATPCSGPFLGGTLAWTLSQRPAVIFIVFMCIGFGMALPYIILTINPKFLKYIPKPGEWIKTFEQIMAFLLIFTVIYLLGIFDTSSLLPMIAFIGFLAVGFWQYGRYGAIYQSIATRTVSSIILILIIITGYFVSFHYLYSEKKITNISAHDFSVQRLLENKDTGRISVIEFTAGWCPNCRLVEKITLHTDKITTALRDSSIDFMVADITGSNPAAEKLMLLFRSQSIPLLAIVPPGESFNRPVILRDIYSEHDVLKAIEMAREGIKRNNVFEYKIEIKNVK